MRKSKFNLSHNASLTADMGYLIPFLTLDCLPNDTHLLNTQSFVRVQPMLAPLMHQVNLYTQYWFVPYRILWENWSEFITGGLDGTATPEFPTITLSKEDRATSTLADYFGIPPAIGEESIKVSALPFRAYAEIWNTRYRDEDLQNELPVVYSDGEDTETSKALQKCSWAKDYFTTARPFTQRGVQISVPVNTLLGEGVAKYNGKITFSTRSSQNVSFNVSWRSNTAGPGGGGMPTGTDVHTFPLIITSIEIPSKFFNDGIDQNLRSYDFKFTGTLTYSDTTGVKTGVLTNSLGVKANVSYNQTTKNNRGSITSTSGGNVSCQVQVVFSDVSLAVDSTPTATNQVIPFNSSVNVVYNTTTTLASSVNIRDLRLASAMQRYQERSLKYGNRYEEYIQREFGIKPRDSRIQRPEYLGGGKSFIRISEVLQTSEGTNTGVGTMRGHGVGSLANKHIRVTTPEHGVIIGILSIRPHGVYTQGLARQWTKFAKLDYFVPELASIGMQEVFASEIYATGDNEQKIFGYQDRYSEYRSQPNRIAGEFRNILNYWNLARDFSAEPVLNSDFITMNPSKRIFAEQTQNSFLIMLRNNIRSYRPIPKRAKNILM